MMSLRKTTLLTIAFAAAIFSSYGQETFRFSHIGIEDGLSQSCVTSIYQDEFDRIWIGTQDGLNCYNGSDIDIFLPRPGDTTTIYSNNVRMICGDGKGKVFVLCKNALCEMDLATERFRTILKDSVMAICYNRDRLWVCTSEVLYSYNGTSLESYYEFDSEQRVNYLCHTSSDNVMIGTASGIVVVDANGRESELLPGKTVMHLYEDSKKSIWVSTQFDGLYRITRGGDTLNFRHDPGNELSLSDNYVRTVCEDLQGNYWIGTFRGVNVFNPFARTMQYADHANSDPYSLPHSSVWAIARDHQGTMWIGIYYGGLSIYNREYDIYHYHKRLFDNQNISLLNCLADSGDGKLWIGTEGAGLLEYTPGTGVQKTYTTRQGAISSDNIKSLWPDRKNNVLWMGTLLGGLNRMDLRSGAVTVYRNRRGDATSLPNNSVRKVVPYGNLLILATHGGVVKFDPSNGSCSPLKMPPEIGERYISDMIVDRKGNCWYAISDGVVKYDLAKDSCEKFFFGDTTLGNNHILVFFEDSRGRIWLGSSGSGVFLYDGPSEPLVNYNRYNSGLANDYILDIDESALGYILIATNGGFVRYDPETERFQTYNRHNGFPVVEMSPYGLFVAENNDIYVSGFKTLISFDENDLTYKNPACGIYFSRLKVNNKEVKVGGEDGLLRQSLLYQHKIDLYNRHTTFEIDYTTSNYIPDDKNDIEYRLIGFDQEWIRGNRSRSAVYTNLTPRTYTLAVRCVDPATRKVLAYNTVMIEIHPPFYRTVWAYLLMAVLAVSIAALLLRFYWGKLKLRSSLELEKCEKRRVEELNQSKLRFFTYVSHELRTPITLIQSQVESILQKNRVQPTVYNKVMSIQRNLTKVTRLINELLDFRKQEQEFLPLNFAKGDITELLERVYVTFRDYASQKGIDFEFVNHSGKPIEAWYDAQQVEKVFYNLLSNAFKFTPENGKILLEVMRDGKDSVVVKVSDSGKGIVESHREKVFDPFFQAPDNGDDSVLGTGLGLPIARGIVKAHYGTISAGDRPGGGAVFTVTLPLGDDHIPPERKVVPQSEDEMCISAAPLPDAEFIDGIVQSQHEIGSRSATILIVEDNDELRALLASLFAPIYGVVEARDGMEALRKMEKELPDIILSDLMMPHMDGNELCIKVKSSFATCHIPFVMLTAKTAAESVLEGIRHGADDYIAKPFDSRILISKCNNLVNSRILLQNRFAHGTSVTPQMIATNALDLEFMEKAMKIVSDNMSDSSFGILELAREMALGRTKLFSKLKSITGQTPNDFITTMRLKKSVEILESDPQTPIGDISFVTGFSSPSYYIRLFRAFYGITPAAYRKNFWQKNG